MATITKSIGTTSRDFSTITLWEADLDDDPTYDSGDIAIGECYDDSAFDESVDLNGGQTIGLASATLTVASAERHDGTDGTGARIVRTTFSDLFLLKISESKIFVEWLECDQNQETGGAAGATCNGAESAGQTAMNWRHLIVHGTRFTSSQSIGIIANVNDAATHNVLNCIVYDVDSPGNRDALGIHTPSNRTTNIYNNTVHDLHTNSVGDPAHCLSVIESGSFALKNNIGTDPVNDGSGGAACYSDSNYTTTDASHNLASDTSASGTGSLDSKAAADQFVSTTVGSEDFHLKSGADAIDAGTDLGTTPTGVNFDIDNRDRDAEGDIWDMGADEFVAAAAPTGPRAGTLPLLGVGK